MHLLYCDESNMEERRGDFLLYGGIAVPADQLTPLSRAIDLLRARARVPRDFKLKFNPGPEGLTHQEFIDLKQNVITVASDHGATMIVYAILHDIATNPDEARRNGINTVCYHFDCLLNRWGGPGLALIDRFNDQGNRIDAHLSEKFSVGITGLPYTHQQRLRNIVGFHYSAVGQAHMPSVVDIALGSLRFALNAHTRDRQNQLETANTLLRILEPLFWRGSTGAVSELSFLFSPKIVNVDAYRERYQAAKEFVAGAGIDIAQDITSERQY